MSSKHQKLIALENKKKVVSLALEGKHITEISSITGLGIDTIYRHINEAIDEAREIFVNDSERLLVKSFIRTEILLEKLMAQVTEEDGSLNMAIVDRIDKLIRTQTRMLIGAQPLRVQISGDKKNPILVERVFSSASAEYEEAIKMVINDPTLMPPDKIQESELGQLDSLPELSEQEKYSLESIFDGTIRIE